MEKQLETEKRILDALEAVSLETGNISVKKVADKAEVSRMTVHRIFGSRENLIARYKEVRGKEILVTKEPVRTKILKSAGKCFAKCGIQGATIEDIAKMAQVGTATVYRHFKDKENLIKAFVEEHGRNRIKQELRYNNDLRSDLVQFAISVLDMLERENDLFKIGLTEAGNNPEIMSQLNNSPNRTLYMVSEYLKNTVCPKNKDLTQEFAMAFMGMIIAFGFLYPYLYMIPLGNKGEKANLIVDLFLNGINGFK